jgi:hypothetical protein
LVDFLNSSPLKPFCQMNRNLVGSIYGRSHNRPIRNKNCLWQPCLLMDRKEMSNLHRGPPIDDTYQVSVYLAKRLQAILVSYWSIFIAITWRPSSVVCRL